jgi:hypothetical protein
MNSPQPLTFAALDGLAFAAERGRLHTQHEMAVLSADTIGPLLEWAGISNAGLLPFPEEASWLSLDRSAPFVAALRSGRRQWVCPATRAAGIFRTSSDWSEDDKQWIGFGLAAQRAAAAAGFHREIAGQFVGAIGEMVSNIYEHSGAPGSGIVAFRAGNDGFEFVVMDDGIGVLESLRSCADYEGVTDHGAALRLALTDGVSRFGPAANRGHGFRPIFVGLANLNGLLRFRSGDHALVIDGQKIDAMFAKTAQKARFKGFLASVSCRLP